MVIVGFCATHRGSGERDERIKMKDGALVMPDLRLPGSALMGVDICPEQCIECCRVETSNMATQFILGALVREENFKHFSDHKFKCILRDRNNVPAQCDLSPVSARRHEGDKQSKVTCKLPPNIGMFGPDKSLEADFKSQLKKLPEKCAHDFVCCCNKVESEEECLPRTVTAEQVTHKSLSTGSDGTFFRLPQFEENESDQCLDSSTDPLEYNIVRHRELVENEHYTSFKVVSEYELDQIDGTYEKRSYFQVDALSTNGRCCRKTKPMTKVLKGTIHGKHRAPREHGLSYNVHHHVEEQLNWIRCVEFEPVFHCSNDGGLTQTGSLYVRVEKGYCSTAKACGAFESYCYCPGGC